DVSTGGIKIVTDKQRMAVATSAISAHAAPPMNATLTRPAGRRNQRPRRRSPLFSASDKNSSTDAADSAPTATAKNQSGEKRVTRTTIGTAIAAVRTLFM